MANIQQRAGRVVVRVGGNTQETAVLVQSTPDGRILEKDMRGISNPVCGISSNFIPYDTLINSSSFYVHYTPFNLLIDTNTTLDLHARAAAHATCYILARERPLAPRCPVQRHAELPLGYCRAGAADPRRLPHWTPGR
jgi:hypothetical protein